MYPTMHLSLAKLKTDAIETIDDLKSEVDDLEQIVQEATGFCNKDPRAGAGIFQSAPEQ